MDSDAQPLDLRLVLSDGEIDRIPARTVQIPLEADGCIEMVLRELDPFIGAISFSIQRRLSADENLGLCISPHGGRSVTVNIGAHSQGRSVSIPPRIVAVTERRGSIEVPLSECGLVAVLGIKCLIRIAAINSRQHVCFRFDAVSSSSGMACSVPDGVLLSVLPAAANLVMIAARETFQFRV